MSKTIVHLCADIGSDSKPYKNAGYNVILVGKDIGVENYNPPPDVYGYFANPVCTEFSVVNKGYHNHGDYEKGLFLVRHCERIFKQSPPKKFQVMENPATGRLKNFLGKPRYEYEPWWFGSAWTKKTALWGEFNIPERKFHKWEDVPKNNRLYIRPSRKKPSMAQFHKSAIHDIEEFHCFKDMVHDDMSLRSLASQKFA